MAAVGHKCPQATQLSRHPAVPMRKLSTGVHKPSRPASRAAGWITPAGHTRMHWPQRVQRAKKSASATAPGGRTTKAGQLPANPPPRRKLGTAAAPAAKDHNSPRRVGSVSAGRGAASGLGWGRYTISPSGQESKQLRHSTHSPQARSPEGAQPPSQARSQVKHPRHSGFFLLSRAGLKRASTPNKAPKGHTNRQ